MEHAVLQMTQEIAQYLETKFQALLRQDYTTHVSFPTHWNLHFLHEVDQIALILLEAFKIQVALPKFGPEPRFELEPSGPN